MTGMEKYKWFVVFYDSDFKYPNENKTFLNNILLYFVMLQLWETITNAKDMVQT